MRYWFKLNEIRDQNNLSEKEITYLKRCTFKQFLPFWQLFRRQWDILLLVKIIGPLLLVIGLYSSSLFYKILFIIPGILIPITFIYIGIRYGRRLAWNRKSWVTFQAYRKSERLWGIFGSLALLIIIFLKCFFTFLSVQTIDSEEVPHFHSVESIQI